MTEQEMCKAICKAASDKKARDIVMMDMQGLMISPDYFVICSANTATQVRAMLESVVGEGGFFSHRPRSATVQAAAPSRLWALPALRFTELSNRQPAIALAC